MTVCLKCAARILYRGEYQKIHGTGENGTVKRTDERKGEPMNNDTIKI